MLFTDPKITKVDVKGIWAALPAAENHIHVLSKGWHHRSGKNKTGLSFDWRLKALGPKSDLVSQMWGAVYRTPLRNSLSKDFCKTHHSLSNMVEIKIHPKIYAPFIFYHWPFTFPYIKQLSISLQKRGKMLRFQDFHFQTSQQTPLTHRHTHTYSEIQYTGAQWKEFSDPLW